MTTVALDAPPRDLVVGEPERTERPAARRRALRVAVACLALLGIYFALSLLNDPRGALGSDTGGKLATLRVMGEGGAFGVDVRYWAERADPSGSMHPLYYTNRVGGQWVQVTTLPQLLVAYPLYRLGGLRVALLVPMLGALATALAARALARRLDPASGWVAFWAVGLATPVAIYALDVWEHALGLGLMAWAIVLVYDVATERGGWKSAAVAGALFGVSATMRTEAFVPLAVATAVGCGWLLAWTRRLAAVAGRAVAIVVGAGAVLFGEHLLERAVLGVDLRSGRTSNTAAAAGTGIARRVEEALITTFGLNGFTGSRSWWLGAAAVALVGAGAFVLLKRPDRPMLGIAMFGIAGVIYCARFSVGLGFVPGLLTACPLAAAGLFVGWSRRSCRLPAVIACVVVPVVWIAQYSGNAMPQWGGRYLLVAGLLLAVVAVVVLRVRRVALVATLALSTAVTAAGVAWLSERSHTVADGMTALVARHDRAVISLEGHVLREGGAFYEPARHWLTVTSDRDLDRAVAIVAGAGDREFGLVAPAAHAVPPRLGGFVRSAVEPLEVRPGERLRVVTYRANSASP